MNNQQTHKNVIIRVPKIIDWARRSADDAAAWKTGNTCRMARISMISIAIIIGTRTTTIIRTTKITKNIIRMINCY